MFDPASLSGWLVPFLVLLVLARWGAEQILARLNQQHVHAHAQSVPEPFRDTMDPATYSKAVEYTLARSRFGRVESTFDALLLAAVLLFGVLPWAYEGIMAFLGPANWTAATAIFLILVGLSLCSLPFAWIAQFRLEARFGFNTTTQRTWWIDRIKGLLLAAVLGYPLLLLILTLLDWAGSLWWLWAWMTLLTFQLGMVFLAPIVIFPLFNRFTPLPEGSLRTRLLALADRTVFPNRNIMVMDGSRRSRHSNAFFTGFGRFRRIVLFDTLIAQLDASELEAVLAHEIAHYKLGHIPRRLLFSLAASFVAFWLLGQLAARPWLNAALGFSQPGIGPLLLAAMVLGGLFSFWLSPILNAWSRRHEYQADRFAVQAVGQANPLIQALRKLTRENLGNLTPHPLYSRFHYSHPTLLEREQALARLENA